MIAFCYSLSLACIGRLPHILSCCHIVPLGLYTRGRYCFAILCAITSDPTPSCLHGFNISSNEGSYSQSSMFSLLVFPIPYRASIPFVFEVPTTLDALHDLISEYASTGADASLIIQRIHATNSVRLNHKNKERMQNFYDVLLKRFVAVGDAIFESGNGGTDLERYEQLNSLTKTLYVMSQDSPECAAAVWSRRLGIFQKGKTNERITFLQVSSRANSVLIFKCSLVIQFSFIQKVT